MEGEALVVRLLGKPRLMPQGQGAQGEKGAAAPGVASGLLWFLHRSWIVSPLSDLDVLYVAASLVRRVPPNPSPRARAIPSSSP